MNADQTIRAGSMQELNKDSGQWVFVDLGFSQNARSCGLLLHDDNPSDLSFSELQRELISIVTARQAPLNLLLEAPLSIAFNSTGNPTGRSIERRGKKTRYWYVGLGCSVLISATYLLRAIINAEPTREIRLFEGLASFKPKGTTSSHSSDVIALGKVGWERESRAGAIVPPGELKMSPTDRLLSAFLVSGMDFGIPPVVVLGGKQGAAFDA